MVVRSPGCPMRLRRRWSRAAGGLLEGTAGIAILSLAKWFLRKWRNWQTRQVEGLVGFTARGGSSPLLRTSIDTPTPWFTRPGRRSVGS